MKKIFKKVMIVLTVLLLFTTVLPNKADKEADASISMTLAALAAGIGASPMLPYVLGAAGIIAIGGVVKDWDVVKDYGEKVIARMGGYDAASGSYVQNPDGTATVIYSPAMKLAMAQAVDAVPETIVKDAGSFTEIYSGNTIEFGNMTGFYDLAIPLQGMNGKTITFDSTQLIDNVQFDFEYTGQSGLSSGYEVARYVGLIDGKYRYQATFEGYDAVTLNTITRAFAMGSGSAFSGILTYALGDITQGTTIDTKDTFGTVADNVNARLLGMNSAITDGQAVTFSPDAELLNASIDDLATISDATLTETQTQTGILSQIWKAILSTIAAINNVSSNVSNAINAKMEDLWQDAGAIWSGLADTATGIRSDITAKMGALQDSMAGGIDNVRSGINDMIAGLNAGIDTVSNNMAAWGQLTLDGIDAGVGAITTGLTNAWTNLKTSINDGVGALQEDLTSIKTFVADFPTTILRVFVPPNFDFMQPLITATTSTLQLKFGPLETLPNVFRNIFGSGKSIYDIEITVMGNTYKIIPIILKPVIDGARPFLTGAINLMTLTILYRRYKGNLVIPA